MILIVKGAKPLIFERSFTMKILLYIYLVCTVIIFVVSKKRYNKMIDNAVNTSQEWNIYFAFLTYLLLWFIILPIVAFKKKITN
jgi:hypothetical protein